VLVIVGIILALLVLTSPFRKKTPLYTTEPVTRSTVSDIVSESGNVASSGRFDVYSTSTGYIEEVYVQNGEEVSTGDNLFKVKSTATAQEQATAYANYQTAVSSEKAAEQNTLTLDALMWTKQQALLAAQNTVNYKNNNAKNPSTNSNYTDLEKEGIDSALVEAQKDFASAEQKYKEAGIAITAGKASVTSTFIAYQATQNVVVTAPAPGRVANFSYSKGDKVSAPVATSLSSTAVPTLVILSDLSKTTIRIPLNEVDVDKVKVGQVATIIFDALRDKQYKGRVINIDTAGTNTNGVITYNATIAIINPDTNIKTEMTATVSIQTAKHTNVLSVPNSAVKPYKGGKAVIVVGKNKNGQVKNKAGKVLPLHYVPVKIGLKGITNTEIIDGVSQNTQVVTSSIN
jgi:multidrug resistance efflux pump